MDFLGTSIQNYVEAHSGQEPELLQELNRETHLKVMMPRMLSGHLQGRVLSFIAKLLRPQTIVDVGTYTGYSALCLAEGLAPGGSLHTIDNNPEHLAFAAKYFEKAGLSNDIHIHEGDAVEILQALDVSPDFAFLDAQKTQYLAYYEALIPKMPAGGVLLTDNVLWSGKVVDKSFTDKQTEALRKFNTFVQEDSRVDNVLLPVRDGLMAVRKRD